MKKLLYCLLCISFLASCDDALTPQEEINGYLSDNNLTAEKTASGLNYIIEVEGIGANPTLADSVVVAYRGMLTDGTVFDQSDRAAFPLTGVIDGWQEGIPLFKKGGKGKLLIPPSIGYGGNTVGPIPANSVLVFDIELLDIR